MHSVTFPMPGSAFSFPLHAWAMGSFCPAKRFNHAGGCGSTRAHCNITHDQSNSLSSSPYTRFQFSGLPLPEPYVNPTGIKGKLVEDSTLRTPASAPQEDKKEQEKAICSAVLLTLLSRGGCGLHKDGIAHGPGTQGHSY